MSPKFVLVLGFLFALSLAVLADTSTVDHTDAVEPQRKRPGPPSTKIPATTEAADETTDAVEPQQRGGGRRCRHGCCGRYVYGKCTYCCPRSTKAAGEESTDEPNTVEPQKRGGGGCRHGCCGSYAYGQCSACCPASKKTATEESSVETKTVEPQKRGGCRHGCCGSYAYGQCSYCCPRKTEKNEEAEAKP